MWGTEGLGLVILGGFMAFLANVLYMLGGTAGWDKLWRRIGAASLLASTANFIALSLQVWVWQYLLFFPCLIIGFYNGYGGDTMFIKVLRRTLYAFGILSTCAAGLWATGFTSAGWLVTCLAAITGLTSVVLGVLNPFKSARLEEFLICQVLTLYVPYWAYIVNGGWYGI
jgi:hypothetical protein